MSTPRLALSAPKASNTTPSRELAPSYDLNRISRF
jgi:hypothetical protein